MNRTIAVLLTCYNRREKTLSCLSQLFLQALPSGVKLQVYLVDDGSTDGTSKAVKSAFPDATVIAGDGSLFWCNGMRLAWRHAAEQDPDFYLWLNDDTDLLPRAIAKLVATCEAAPGGLCIAVSSCSDPDTGCLTYGGQMLSGKHPARLSLAEPSPTTTKDCDTFNGNAVLITRAVFKRLGIMRSFRHSTGDTDYGLLARKAGIPIRLAPGFLAHCRDNPIEGSWRDRTMRTAARMRQLLGRKGLPPADWWRFLWAHAGIRAIIYWPAPYLRVIAGR